MGCVWMRCGMLPVTLISSPGRLYLLVHFHVILASLYSSLHRDRRLTKWQVGDTRIPHTLWKWIHAFQYPSYFYALLGLLFTSVQNLDVKVFCFSSIVRIYIRMLSFEAIHIFLILGLSLGMCGPETRSAGRVAHCLKYCSFLEDPFSLYVLLKCYIPQRTPSLTTLRPSFVI